MVGKHTEKEFDARCLLEHGVQASGEAEHCAVQRCLMRLPRRPARLLYHGVHAVWVNVCTVCNVDKALCAARCSTNPRSCPGTQDADVPVS